VIPPATLSTQLDLNILIDTSSNTTAYQNLIRNNLKGLLKYLNDQEIDLQVKINVFDEEIQFQSTQLEEIYSFIDQLKFEANPISKKDGFQKIIETSQMQSRPGAQKIMLIL